MRVPEIPKTTPHDPLSLQCDEDLDMHGVGVDREERTFECMNAVREGFGEG